MRLKNISEMAASTYTKWGDDEIGSVAGKDYLGVPKMARPGFRRQDKQQIIKNSKEVEQWLNRATEKHGIHWVVIYLEPTAQMQHGLGDWNAYQQMGQQAGADYMNDFHQQLSAVAPQINPSNTIVYIKPTSRVHTLSPWQQIHNIGHAVWQQCQDERATCENFLSKIIYDLQQAAYDKSGEPPSKAEISVMLGRLLDVQSLQRIFSLQPGDLNVPAKRLNTTIASMDELMYELIAVFLRNGGNIPLRGRGEVQKAAGKVATPDRRGEMTPNQEVSSLGVRSWVWQALASDDAAWKEAAQRLNEIVVAALRKCTWSVVGGPVYATSGTLTTEP